MDTGFAGNELARSAGDVPEPRFLESAETDQILSSLCKAMLGMVNPRRDREAKVRGITEAGKPYEYTYRYSTLGVINDMIREPFGDNGLFVMSRPIRATAPNKGYELLTQVRHVSGQWLGCLWPLGEVNMRKFMQDFAGNTTYARRYSICALLNIASGDDDDNNAASDRPASIAVVDAMKEVHATDEQTQRAVHRQLLMHARDAKTPSEVEGLLTLWQGVMERYARWQGNPDQRAAFDQVAAELQSCLTRFDASLGEVWFAVMQAQSRRDVDALHARFMKSPNAPLGALKVRAPRIFALLREHLTYFSERACVMDPSGTPIDDKVAEVDRAFRPPPVTAEPPAAAPPHPAMDDRSDLPCDTEPGLPTAFAHHVLDENGEIATDLHIDPVAWAEAYHALWRVSAQPVELDRHNRAALDAIEHFEAAMHRLDTLMNQMDAGDGETLAPAEEAPRAPLVWPRRARGGALDVQAALKLVTYELDTFCHDAAAVDQFEAINGPLWLAEDCPPTLRLKCREALMKRRRDVGAA